jgi:hypothetical protein
MFWGRCPQNTQLAATPAIQQVQAGNSDLRPQKAYGLNMGHLPTGLEAALYCRCPPSHHNWLPGMVGSPQNAILLKMGLEKSFRKLKTNASEPSLEPTRLYQYKASRQK